MATQSQTDIQTTTGTQQISQDRSSSNALNHLIDTLVESARTFMHASENVETRGPKLMLKTVGRQRLQFVRQLQHYLPDQHPDVTVPHNLMSELQRGMTDMQASMTLKREGRQEIVLSEELAYERRLLNAYADALAAIGASGPLQARLREQQAQVQGSVARLEEITQGDCELVARLFNDEDAGQQAVMRLQNQGFAASDIDAVALEQLPTPSMRNVQRSQTGVKPTLIGGAISGALVGALMGLAYALFIWFGPDATQAQQPILSPTVIWVASIIFAALMGAAFGYLIGRNKVEDDTFVTAQSVEQGEYLVVVYADPNRATLAENILQVHHGSELGRA